MNWLGLGVDDLTGSGRRTKGDEKLVFEICLSRLRVVLCKTRKLGI